MRMLSAKRNTERNWCMYIPNDEFNAVLGHVEGVETSLPHFSNLGTVSKTS